MSEKNEKPKAPIDFSHIGGKKVGHPAPEKAEKHIDFSSIGGKCVRKAPEPDALEEKDVEAHTG